jgi:hypothetical protein
MGGRARLTITERCLIDTLPARRPPGVTARQWAALSARVRERTPYRALGARLGISAMGAYELTRRALDALEREGDRAGGDLRSLT